MKKTLTFFIALIWLINGLFCKILNLVPRHQEIVSEILGHPHSFALTKTIGILEVMMSLWILSEKKSQACSIIQIAVVLLMNCIEFFAVPKLLLFGRWNIVIAFFFAIVVYYNEFIRNKSNSACLR